MKRSDIFVIVALVGLLLIMPKLDRKFIRPLFPEKAAPAQVQSAATTNRTQTETALLSADAGKPAAVAPEGNDITGRTSGQKQAMEDVDSAKSDLPEERMYTISNQQVEVSISSYGASIKSVILNQYTLDNTNGSPLVELAFSDEPALMYSEAPWSEQTVFSVAASETGGLVLEAQGNGFHFMRRIELPETGYMLDVSDRIGNQSATTNTWPRCWVQTGSMKELAGSSTMRGMISLGIDTFSPGAKKVQHFGRKIKKFFKNEKQMSADGRMPDVIGHMPHEEQVIWVAAKNQYFAQILMPGAVADRGKVIAAREKTASEIAEGTLGSGFTEIAYVAGAIGYDEYTMQPGETLEMQYQYYAGPKKYKELKALHNHQDEIITEGVWSFLRWLTVPVSSGLLWMLNVIHDHLWPHNYGVAIILMTILVRIIFWPVTHKSTESMRRMQDVKPLIDEINEKYKDDAQKKQQKMMEMYKEHKINPLGGCLPMLIQIPVFISLFDVLRSSIELRFSSFLWINDLSRPEMLFADVLPIPINILPLLMAGTMFWQQKLTPTGGDSQQQKMMAFMPVFMLVILYNFPSGLALYWTTNQCLMIVQQVVYKKRKAAGSA